MRGHTAPGLARGVFRPRCIPRTRALRPVDPDQALRPGPDQGSLRAPLRNPWPGAFLPLDPDKGYRALDHSPGLSRPGTHEQAAFVPLHPDQRAFVPFGNQTGGDPLDPRAAGLNVIEPRARCFGSGAFDQGRIPWNPSTAGEQP